MHYEDRNEIGFATLELMHTRPDEVWFKYELSKTADETYL